jgi:ATP-dependent RNA helicase RhlE
VFTRTKRGANRVAETLDSRGVRSEAIHGNKSQNARQKALDNFSRGKARVLVATDLASRGIDVTGVTHVINYELPADAESYVHRIGRTGRAGASGIAFSFCDGSERGQLKSIERLINQRIAVLPVPGPDQMAPEPALVARSEREDDREESPRGPRGDNRGDHRGPRGGHRGGPRSGPDHRATRTFGDRPYGDRPQGARPQGARPQGDRPQGDRPHGDRSHSARPHSDRPHSDRPHSDRPHSDRPQAARPEGERRWAGGDFRDQPRGENRPQGAPRGGDRPYNDRPRSGAPQGDRPYSDRPRGDRPHADRPHADRPHGDRPHADRPQGDRPPAPRPAWKGRRFGGSGGGRGRAA